MSLTTWADRPSNASLITEEQLAAPPVGCVWVEWVGEASPVDSPLVRYRLLTGQYSAEQTAVIRRLMEMRVARTHKHTRTNRRGNGIGQEPTLGVEFVRFGPDERRRPGERGAFTQAVPFKAADAIKASPSGHEFRIWNERDGEQQNLIAMPERAIRIAAEEAFQDFGGFRRAMGW